jgi:hypothetical protein
VISKCTAGVCLEASQDEYDLRPHSSIMLRGLLLLHFLQASSSCTALLHLMLRGLLLLHFLHPFSSSSSSLSSSSSSSSFLPPPPSSCRLLIPCRCLLPFFPSFLLRPPLFFLRNLSNSTTSSSSSSYADDDDDVDEGDVRKKERVRITREERKLDADDYSLIQVGWYKSTNTDAAAG